MQKKKILILMLCLGMILLMSGCGSETEARKLSFSETIDLETLKSLDNQPVTITGYMATLSPLDGRYIYLMNMPYQSCPFCVPNTTQLSNTIAVYASKNVTFEFTDRPVQITGILRIQDKTDEYGYTYNYYIDDAAYTAVDLSSVSREYALYQSLAEDGVIADVNAMFDYLMFVCQWTDYQGSYTQEDGTQITYFLYPGDAENILLDDGPYGYAAQASEDYFPGLIRRVEGISATELTTLTDIIADAQALEQYARAQLAEEQYVYDEATDQYTLINGEELYNQFYDVYTRFAQWLAEYEL